jgi:hypothetical protein
LVVKRICHVIHDKSCDWALTRPSWNNLHHAPYSCQYQHSSTRHHQISTALIVSNRTSHIKQHLTPHHTTHGQTDSDGFGIPSALPQRAGTSQGVNSSVGEGAPGFNSECDNPKVGVFMYVYVFSECYSFLEICGNELENVCIVLMKFTMQYYFE